MMIRTLGLGGVLTGALAVTTGAYALTVDVTSTNLGSGTWRYSYFLSDAVFQENEGFTIYFDYTLYGALSNPTVDNGDWDLIGVDPDPTGLPADGFLDGLALVDAASLADPFAIDFEWLGSGSPPGNQLFDTYVCADDNCNGLQITDSGITGGTAEAPAPLALLAVGLISLGLRRTSALWRTIHPADPAT